MLLMRKGRFNRYIYTGFYVIDEDLRSLYYLVR